MKTKANIAEAGLRTYMPLYKFIKPSWVVL